MCDIGNREFLYLLIPIIFYILSILFGLMGSISMALSRDDNRGHCTLYADSNSSTPSSCNYVIGIHSLVCILIALLLTCVFSFAIYRRRIAQPLSFLSTIPFLIGFVVLHAVSCFLIFVAACVASAGFDKTCDNVGSCHFWGASKVRTTEAGSWLGFLCWLLLTALFSFRLWHSLRYGEVITTGSSTTSATSVSRTTTVVVEKSTSSPVAY